MALACLQRRPDRPTLNKVAWRPWQSGCLCAAYARVMVACARPGRAVLLAPIHAVAGPTKSNAKPTSEPTVPSPTDAYPRPRHDAPREPPARQAVPSRQPSWLPEAASVRVAVTDAAGARQVIGTPGLNSTMGAFVLGLQ